VPAVITTWLRTEAAEEETSKNTTTQFVAMFFPIATVHFIAHVFLYNHTPTSPQYMVSLLLELLHLNREEGALYVTVFGCIELILVLYDWAITFFYVTTLLGCGCTVKALIQRSE